MMAAIMNTQAIKNMTTLIDIRIMVKVYSFLVATAAQK